jgi:tRNA threonylcarbamoyl adenosine modification protein YeaZ
MGVNERGFDMTRQYSFSRSHVRPSLDLCKTVLAVDTGSPVVSVAIAIAGEIAAEETCTAQRSSSRLLELIDSCLHRVHLEAAAIDLLIGLRGPGSFTGLRVGLATLQGMRLALQIPAGTLTTFEVLASLGDPDARQVIACVDAMRGEWMLQRFAAGRPAGPPQRAQRWSSDELGAMNPGCLVGYGVSRLGSVIAATPGVTLIEPGPLAPQALRLLSSPEVFDWRSDNLSRPLYLSPPVVSRPAGRL